MSIASEITRLQGAKADLATAIEGKGVSVPSATKLDGYADLVDAISQGGGGGTMQSKSVSYTPSTSAQSQTVTADAGYDGLSSVAVSVAAMPSGTEGTPVATKGTVSNNSIAVTPSVTNSAGYIEGGTKTGTAVTVSASELVAGYQIKTANGTYDVTNLASLIVQVPNSYSASDEGKVVSNGALVAQTSDTVTTNDTYDTTLINSLTVNVSGGPSGYETGTYIPASNTQEIQIPVTATYSNFVFSVDQKQSALNLNAQTGILGRAFSNGDGYIMDTGSGSYFTGNWRATDTTRQYAHFTSSEIKASFLGNGARVWFVAGNTYQWLAW